VSVISSDPSSFSWNPLGVIWLGLLRQVACVYSTLRHAETLIFPEQFTDFYYKTFDEDRQNLAALYVGIDGACWHKCLRLTCHAKRDNSMLTFETAAIAGAAGIVEKLVV
jgi:hypothetical protein